MTDHESAKFAKDPSAELGNRPVDGARSPRALSRTSTNKLTRFLNLGAFATAIVLTASSVVFGARTASVFCRGSLGPDGSAQVACGPEDCIKRIPAISPDPQEVQATDLALSFISDFCESASRFLVLTKHSLIKCQRKGACGGMRVIGPLDAPPSRYAGQWECYGNRHRIICSHISRASMPPKAALPVYEPPEAQASASSTSRRAAIDNLVLLFALEGRASALPPLGPPAAIAVSPDCQDYYDWCFGQAEPDLQACRSYIAECR